MNTRIAIFTGNAKYLDNACKQAQDKVNAWLAKAVGEVLVMTTNIAQGDGEWLVTITLVVKQWEAIG